MESAIILKQLTTGYRQKGKSRVVCKEMNATLMSGQLTCLIGPNGTGKSTLLRTLAAFQPALDGEIVFLGKPLNQYSNEELAKRISIVLTNNSHIKNLTTYEVIGLGRSPYTGFWGRLSEHDHQIIRQCIQRVGIEKVAQQAFQTLSDGERQKAMIAKAIAQETPVILLDEPTAFLYYPNKVGVMLMLRSLAHDMAKTILMSIHDIDLALQVADNIWLLTEEGTLINGTPEQLCSDGTIQRHVVSQDIEFDTSRRTFSITLPPLSQSSSIPYTKNI
jgi:iron complex transport system ATP-binding protein